MYRETFKKVLKNFSSSTYYFSLFFSPLLFILYYPALPHAISNSGSPADTLVIDQYVSWYLLFLCAFIPMLSTFDLFLQLPSSPSPSLTRCFTTPHFHFFHLSSNPSFLVHTHTHKGSLSLASPFITKNLVLPVFTFIPYS